MKEPKGTQKGEIIINGLIENHYNNSSDSDINTTPIENGKENPIRSFLFADDSSDGQSLVKGNF